MNPILKVLMIELKEFCSACLVREQIEKIFLDAGFQRKNSSEPIESFSRRGLVEAYYENANWEEKSTINKLYQAIINILKLPWLKEEARKYLITTSQELGINIKDPRDFYLSIDQFVSQFPAGLPFGKIKPNFGIKAEKGSQNLRFEWQDGIGILKSDVYPNFSYQNLSNMFGCTPETDYTLKWSLIQMNQTNCEEFFFRSYANKFQMYNSYVPMLIPQAWIQWHSLVKRQLNSGNNLQADDIYRIDFVAFWNNKRFAIQIDDISHYSVNKNGSWLANEKSYLKTLREERSLRKEGWEVFRLSNFEIKNNELLTEALNDVKRFLDF